MSYSETPVATLKRFAETSDWIRRSSLDALAGDLLVGQAESSLKWFTCVYQDVNGVLYSPVMRGAIIGTDGKMQSQIEFNSELQNWFLSNDEGLAIGISPKGGLYKHPDNQIQIYRITYELIRDENGRIIDQKKSLLCAFHQFEYDYSNPEEIRRFIFPQKDSEENVIETVNWLKQISKKNVSSSSVNNPENIKIAYSYAMQLKNGVNPEYIFNLMYQDNFLGNNPIGCANSTTTTSNVSLLFFNNENISWSYHTGNCVNCLATNVLVGPCSICKSCEKIL